MASCSQTGIYTLLPPVDFNCVCYCQLLWLSRCIKSQKLHVLYLSDLINTETTNHIVSQKLHVLYLMDGRTAPRTAAMDTWTCSAEVRGGGGRRFEDGNTISTLPE